MDRMRRATRGLSATSSGGNFSAAEATTLGGSSGEKMRALAALSTGSWQATVASARAAATVNLWKRVTTPPAPIEGCPNYGAGAGAARDGFARANVRDRTPSMQNLRDKLLKAGLVSEDQA